MADFGDPAVIHCRLGRRATLEVALALQRAGEAQVQSNPEAALDDLGLAQTLRHEVETFDC
jgi:hypothetical protein